MADITKAKEKLKWQPRIKFHELVRIMMDYDLRLSGLNPNGEGIAISKERGFDWTDHDYAFYEKIREGK